MYIPKSLSAVAAAAVLVAAGPALADIARTAPVLGQREAAELVLQLTRAISQRPHETIDAHAAE